jgi:hypothetical protein
MSVNVSWDSGRANELKVVTVVATKVTVPTGKVALVVPVAVKVNPKLPERISAADALFGIVKVPTVEVIMSPLIEVAVATPRAGVINVGDLNKSAQVIFLVMLLATSTIGITSVAVGVVYAVS